MRDCLLLVAIVGFSEGLSFRSQGLPGDACTNSPCGPGAICETTTTLIVCKCPSGFSGDPFEKCFERILPVAENTHSQTESVTTHAPTTFQISSSPEKQSHEDSTRMTGSNGFTTEFKVDTDYSRVPIRGPSSTSFATTPRTYLPLSESSNSNNSPPKYLSPSSKYEPTTSGIFMTHQFQQMNNDYRRPILQHESSTQGIRLTSQNQNYQQNIPAYHKKPDTSLNSFSNDQIGQLSQFVNCRTNMNGIVVCADNSVDDSYSNGNMRPGNKYSSNGLLISNDVQEQDRPFSSFQNHYQQNQQNSENNFPNYQMPQHQTESSQQQHFSQKLIGNHFQEQNRENLNTDKSNDLCKSMCGINSICRLVIGRPVCGCPEGHTGDPSVSCFPIPNETTMKSGCDKHPDCPLSEICVQSQCVDPCNNSFKSTSDHSHNGGMCGQNAKCMVVEHTPLCGCKEGFYGNPYLACLA